MIDPCNDFYKRSSVQANKQQRLSLAFVFVYFVEGTKSHKCLDIGNIGKSEISRFWKLSLFPLSTVHLVDTSTSEKHRKVGNIDQHRLTEKNCTSPSTSLLHSGRSKLAPVGGGRATPAARGDERTYRFVKT